MPINIQNAFQLSLEDLIRKTFGNQTSIAEVVALSSRAAVTARLVLRGSGPPSVFIKHIAADAFPALQLVDTHVEFAEELLAQRFLQSLQPSAPFRANLLAFDQQGIFLLDDLGESGHSTMRSFDYIIERLSRSLAILHLCTREQATHYYGMRQEAGLGHPGDDRRRYGGPAQLKRFQVGQKMLLALAGRRNIDSNEMEQELERVRAIVTTPGPFLALIHDDLGNARQTFEQGDDLFLLDFEYARFGLSLIDLCKPMMGKFEVNLDNGNYLWNDPHFPITLAEAYRKHLEEIGHLCFPDQQWYDGLSAALIFHTLTLLGRLDHLEPDRRLVGTVQQNVNGILFRLLELLPAHDKIMVPFLNAYFNK
ncbi:hypothetical protein [Arachidicoccus terrestris]|uniref:hypothetical protein n=1 Tax=Arachidicoccus terrestris TaxID=2875539 RepID=UPI001CC6E126|nr:hypothetical protein [Arachidicoccus terrestris]UAY54333.1 hypothetical protein K9M52_12825 [Arachidicoccus terrestris]